MNTARTIGRYEIVGELGRGAMGSVFKARDPAVGRIVALKTILSAALGGAQSEQYGSRFLREAHAAGSLAHPGIVPVFDVGEHEGVPFLVMEFVDGKTLADALKMGEPLTLERVCEIGGQLAEALGYAHRHGVIHRDIKPANILMTSREAYGAERPRITDFGIAKLTANEVTATGQLLGTPSFMPPEQFTGSPIDGRADLFSLGVILYSLATGEQPFSGETMTAVSYKVVHTLPVPPSKLNPAIPPHLEAVILKCLAKNPADRYQTGEELAQDLAAARAHSATMQSTAPTPHVTSLDSDITTNGEPLQSSAANEAPVTNAARASAKPGMKSLAVIAAAAIALIVVAFTVHTWLGIRHRIQASRMLPQTAEHAAGIVGHGAAPAKPSPSVEEKVPAPAPAAAAMSQAAAPGSTPALPPGTAPMSASKPAALAFNPRSLNPKTSARLRVELKHVPDGLGFTIQMNGRPYLHTVAGDKRSLQNLFVPPGIQRFSIVYVSAGRQRFTNIVSDEFKVKKRRTLHIELIGQPKSSIIAQGGLTGNGQLFLSLK